MVDCLPDNPLIDKIFGIFLQVTLIFVFLTFFFFIYVDSTEKDSFKTQMNIVIDDLAPDLNVRSIVPKGQENDAIVLLDGTLELARLNSTNKSKESDQQINLQNSKIKKNTFIFVGISIGILILTMIILYFSGRCLPFHIHLKDALILILVVAMTELIFLSIITKNYWSVDPNSVRKELGGSIQKWIQINHPQK